MAERSSLSFEDLGVGIRRRSGASPEVEMLGAPDGTVAVMARWEACQLAAQLVEAAWGADPPDPSGSVTLAEFSLMARLFHKYAETALDQWEAFSVTTTYGPVYLMLSRSVEQTDGFVNLDGYLTDSDGSAPPA